MYIYIYIYIYIYRCKVKGNIQYCKYKGWPHCDINIRNTEEAILFHHPHHQRAEKVKFRTENVLLVPGSKRFHLLPGT